MRERLIEVEIPNTLDERVVDAASDCRGSLKVSSAWSLLGRLVSGVHPGGPMGAVSSTCTAQRRADMQSLHMQHP